MKSGVIVFIFAAILLVSSASAAELTVEKTEKEATIISELDNPAVYDFIITNDGAPGKFQLYSYVGVRFEPSGFFNLPNGDTSMQVNAYPGEKARSEAGVYSFEYQINTADSVAFSDKLAIKIIKLKDLFDITIQPIRYDDDNAVIAIKNLNNIKVEDIKISLESVLFEGEKKLSFAPFETKTMTLGLKTGEIKDLKAGSYVITGKYSIEDAGASVESTVKYLEKQNIAVSRENSGWIIRTTDIKKTNEGNTLAIDDTEITKNILTRLFTTFSAEPLSTERKGLFVNYKWQNELSPAESWNLVVKTNYTLPFVLIILVIVSAGLVYLYSRTAVVVKKRVYYVKTRGGELALKVMLNVKARTAVDNVEIYDRIPSAMKLFERTGMVNNIDERTGKLVWKVDKLNAGEDRIFSYIIYSPLGIVGRVELSPATTHFVKGGKSKYVSSNRTYFVSDITPRV